jgi:hypothetical protein
MLGHLFECGLFEWIPNAATFYPEKESKTFPTSEILGWLILGRADLLSELVLQRTRGDIQSRN